MTWPPENSFSSSRVVLKAHKRNFTTLNLLSSQVQSDELIKNTPSSSRGLKRFDRRFSNQEHNLRITTQNSLPEQLFSVQQSTPQNRLSDNSINHTPTQLSDVSIIFNKITDVYDKELVKQAIQLVQNPKERSELIDKVLARRNEIKNAEQIMQISKCAPLVQRFMNKVWKKNKEHTSPLSSPKEVKIQSPVITTGSSRKSQFFQDDFESIDATPLYAPRSFSSALSFLKTGSNIITKGIAFSLFYKPKQQKQLDLTEFGGQKNQALDSSITSSPSVTYKQGPNEEQDFKKKRHLSFISSDNILLKNKSIISTNTSTNEPNRFSKVNLQSVSQNSHAMEMRGKYQNRAHATALLKDFQKINLAQHFKSKAINVSGFKDAEINTFNYQLTLQQKNQKAKVNSSHGNNELSQTIFKRLNSYSNPAEVIQIVSDDVSKFVVSQSANRGDSTVTSNFFSPKSSLKLSQLRRIETNASNILQSQNEQKVSKIQSELSSTLRMSSNTTNTSFEEKNCNNLKESYSKQLKQLTLSPVKPFSSNLESHMGDRFPGFGISSPVSQKASKQSFFSQPQSPLKTKSQIYFASQNQLSNQVKEKQIKFLPLNSETQVQQKSIANEIAIPQLTQNKHFKNPSSNKPYRIVSTLNGSSDNMKAKIKSNIVSSLQDVVHTSVPSDLNTSFASLTEIKLDHLYKESTQLQKMIYELDSQQPKKEDKFEQQIEQKINDLNKARKQQELIQ